MLALPSSRLYSWALQATGPNLSLRWMEGEPPPGHTTSCHAPNAFWAMAVAVSRSTCREAWYCIEYETHSSGHWSGIPAGQPVTGSMSHFFPHVIVRQNACADRLELAAA